MRNVLLSTENQTRKSVRTQDVRGCDVSFSIFRMAYNQDWPPFYTRRSSAARDRSTIATLSECHWTGSPSRPVQIASCRQTVPFVVLFSYCMFVAKYAPSSALPLPKVPPLQRTPWSFRASPSPTKHTSLRRKCHAHTRCPATMRTACAWESSAATFTNRDAALPGCG